MEKQHVIPIMLAASILLAAISTGFISLQFAKGGGTSGGGSGNTQGGTSGGGSGNTQGGTSGG